MIEQNKAQKRSITGRFLRLKGHAPLGFCGRSSPVQCNPKSSPPIYFGLLSLC